MGSPEERERLARQLDLLARLMRGTDRAGVADDLDRAAALLRPTDRAVGAPEPETERESGREPTLTEISHALRYIDERGEGRFDPDVLRWTLDEFRKLIGRTPQAPPDENTIGETFLLTEIKRLRRDRNFLRQQIVKAADAITHDRDLDEAYHRMYEAADPQFRCMGHPFDAWREAPPEQREELLAGDLILAPPERESEERDLAEWVLLYDDAIREGSDADAVFHDMVRAARLLRTPSPPVLHEEREDGGWPRCAGCRRPYSDPGFPDLVVPNHVWAEISPTGDEGGLLCPACIIGYCEEQRVACVATFRSGSLSGQTLTFEPTDSAVPATPAWESDTEATNRRLGAVAGKNYYPGVECEHGHDFCPECDAPEPTDSAEGEPE